MTSSPKLRRFLFLLIVLGIVMAAYLVLTRLQYVDSQLSNDEKRLTSIQKRQVSPFHFECLPYTTETKYIERSLFSDYVNNSARIYYPGIVARIHSNGTTVDGLMVGSISPNSIFVKMGLCDNDLILAVNGSPLGDFNNFPKLLLLDNSSSGTVMRVSIERNSERKTLSYGVKD